MYIHLGQDTMMNLKELVGIFDLDTASLSKKTREFLARAEKEGRVVNTSTELPKSFAVTCDKHKTVYINQLSTPTLKGRIEALPGRKKHL